MVLDIEGLGHDHCVFHGARRKHGEVTYDYTTQSTLEREYS